MNKKLKDKLTEDAKLGKNGTNVILEPTDKILIHNFPPSSSSTYSYLTRIYREYNEDVFGWKEVEGEPMYLHDLPQSIVFVAEIMGAAHNELLRLLPAKKINIKK